MKSYYGSGSFSDLTFGEAFFLFSGVSVGSIVVGVGVALAGSFLLKHVPELREMPSYEFTIIVLFAYLSYCMAEIIELCVSFLFTFLLHLFAFLLVIHPTKYACPFHTPSSLP